MPDLTAQSTVGSPYLSFTSLKNISSLREKLRALPSFLFLFAWWLKSTVLENSVYDFHILTISGQTIFECGKITDFCCELFKMKNFKWRILRYPLNVEN